MKARFFADLNPGYPAKGQHRWAVFLSRGPELKLVKSYRVRRSAEKLACELETRAWLEAIGIKAST